MDSRLAIYKAPKPSYGIQKKIEFVITMIKEFMGKKKPPEEFYIFQESLDIRDIWAIQKSELLLAQFFHDQADMIQELNNRGNRKLIKHASRIVVTHDDCYLDTLELQFPKAEQYIINFVSNEMCYEQIFSLMLIEAKKHESNIIGFNYRGVNQSTGQVAVLSNLVVDGIAQVQRLLDAGVPPAKIFLKEHNFKLAITQLVITYFRDNGISINLFDNSSSSQIILQLETSAQPVEIEHEIEDDSEVEVKPETIVLGRPKAKRLTLSPAVTTGFIVGSVAGYIIGGLLAPMTLGASLLVVPILGFIVGGLIGWVATRLSKTNKANSINDDPNQIIFDQGYQYPLPCKGSEPVMDARPINEDSPKTTENLTESHQLR